MFAWVVEDDGVDSSGMVDPDFCIDESDQALLQP